MMTLNDFRKTWVGRTFKCRDTEETFTIPEEECDHSYAREGWKCPECGKDGRDC